MLERIGGSVQLLHQITEVFLRKWEVDFERLSSALKAGEKDAALHAIGHLKVSLGFFADRDLLRKVEDLFQAVDQSGPATGPLLVALEADLKELVAALRELKVTLARRAVA